MNDSSDASHQRTDNDVPAHRRAEPETVRLRSLLSTLTKAVAVVAAFTGAVLALTYGASTSVHPLLNVALTLLVIAALGVVLAVMLGELRQENTELQAENAELRATIANVRAENTREHQALHAQIGELADTVHATTQASQAEASRTREDLGRQIDALAESMEAVALAARDRVGQQRRRHSG